MMNLFAQLVQKLVDYHFYGEQKHWRECNPDIKDDGAGWLDDVPGTTLHRTGNRFCIKTQFNGLTTCIIDIQAKRSVLLQGADAGEFLRKLTPTVLATDEMFNSACSEYTHVMEPEVHAQATDPHVFDDIQLLQAHFPVTMEKVVGNQQIERALDNLLSYDRESEAGDFASLFEISDNPESMTTHEVLGYGKRGQPADHGISDAVKHIYQVIRYLQNELEVAALKKVAHDLGESIEKGDPQAIAGCWFRVRLMLD